MFRTGWLSAVVLGLGCGLAEDTKPKGGTVIGKRTQNIQEFNPNAQGMKVSKAEFEYTDPISGPLQAYGPALERAFVPMVNREIETFRALNGRYPKDYKEFMDEVIKKNDIKLPVLPGGKTWTYDPKEHVVKVMEPKTSTDQ